MTLASHERAIWLSRHALPHEPALRTWLSRRPLAGLEVDDVVQETYAILAALPAVDHILTPRTYMFEVAKSVVLRALRRGRVVAFETLAEAETLEPPSAEPSPETVTADRQELSRIAALLNCPVVCANGCPWPAPWLWTQRCCCWTNLFRPLMH